MEVQIRETGGDGVWEWVRGGVGGDESGGVVGGWLVGWLVVVGNKEGSRKG